MLLTGSTGHIELRACKALHVVGYLLLRTTISFMVTVILFGVTS